MSWLYTCVAPFSEFSASSVALSCDPSLQPLCVVQLCNLQLKLIVNWLQEQDENE